MKATDCIVLLVPLVIGLASVLLPRIRPARIPDFSDEPLTREERRVYNRWEFGSVLPILLGGAVLGYPYYLAIMRAASRFHHETSDMLILAQPTPSFWAFGAGLRPGGLEATLIRISQSLHCLSILTRRLLFMKPIALAGLAALLVAVATRANEPTAQSAPAPETSKSDDQQRRSEGLIARQYAQIRADFEAQQAAHRPAATKPERTHDKGDAAPKASLDVVAYCRRMLDLAESSPDHPAARDALLWVINTPGTAGMDVRAHRDQVARAGALLVRHHSDDPEAVRIGLTLSNASNFQRDALFFGFYLGAKGHEAKGLARLALANYLNLKARGAAYAQSVDGRPKRRFFSAGKVVRELDLTDEEYADHLALRHCDPQKLRDQAERLYEEVITEYGDIPYVTWRHRELEALLKEPAPQWNGKPLTDERRHSLEAMLANKSTLEKEATDRLDVMVNLAVGRPAPDIDGTDMDGKPLRLSDFKGKVVVLNFWGTWCGPCMALVPRERELVARLKDQPFALLGVDCKDNREAARQAMAQEGMTWPSWHDGAADRGPIAERYHVRGYPAIFVIDSKGIIRGRNPFTVDQHLVDKLLEEMKRPTPPQGASPPSSQE
jgi:thiol-disulfide isomerase/thioredoxin